MLGPEGTAPILPGTNTDLLEELIELQVFEKVGFNRVGLLKNLSFYTMRFVQWTRLLGLRKADNMVLKFEDNRRIVVEAAD